MDPVDRQAATLAALDERAERMRRIQELAECNPKMRAQRLAVAEDLVITAGRRSILVRHVPALEDHCDCPECGNAFWCGRCRGQWPCPDWRDASAGLEVPDA